MPRLLHSRQIVLQYTGSTQYVDLEIVPEIVCLQPTKWLQVDTAGAVYHTMNGFIGGGQGVR
jgi:hypothetical protein